MAQLKYMLYAHYGSVVLTDEKVFDTDDQALWEDVRSSAEFHYDGDDFAIAFPSKAPSNPALWLELFQIIDYYEWDSPGDLGMNGVQVWQDREFHGEIIDGDGKVVAKE